MQKPQITCEGKAGEYRNVSRLYQIASGAADNAAVDTKSLLSSGQLEVSAKTTKKKMPLRDGGRGFCGGFRSVDHNGLFTAFGGGRVDGIQVDAFRRELIEALREGAGLVGQIAGFRGSFVIRDAGGVKSLLRAPGVI